MGTWKTWSSQKKCKWICLWSMVMSMVIVLTSILYGLISHHVSDAIVIALITWAGSMTGVFGLVVAGIHKYESKEQPAKK